MEPPPPLSRQDSNQLAPPGLIKAPWPEKRREQSNRQRVRAVNTVRHVRQERSTGSDNHSNKAKAPQQQQQQQADTTTAAAATDQPTSQRRRRRPAGASSRPHVASGRTSWMNQGAVIGSRGPGTGMYGRPSSKASANSSSKNVSKRISPDTGTNDRDELISLRVEYKAQEQLVQMLTNRVNKMTTEVERGKLVTRAMEGQLLQAQHEATRANRRTEESRAEETVVGDQLDRYKYDLEEVQENNRRLETEMSQITHERDQALFQIQTLTQQSQAREQNNRASTSSLQEMHGVNAGLRRQLKDEQNRIVQSRNEVRQAQAEVQRVYMELSTRDSELHMERDRTTQMASKIEQHEEIIIKLKEKMAKIADSLNRAQDVRRTAIRRAEVTASKAKKMESEVAGTDKLVADYEFKLTNLQGQIAMKDRRIQLMKKQHQSEIASHQGTQAEREALEQEVAQLTKHLNVAENALNERALQVVRGGPVVEGREDLAMRDSLEVQQPRSFQPISMADAMRMGGGSRVPLNNKPQQRQQQHRVQFKRLESQSGVDPSSNVCIPSMKKKTKVSSNIVRKKSRKENLAAIRKMTSNMPDAAKLPGSDAPAWMQDDDHEIM